MKKATTHTKTKKKSPTKKHKLISKFDYTVDSENVKRQDSLDNAIIYYGIQKLLKRLKILSKSDGYTTTQKETIKNDIDWLNKRYEEQQKSKA